MTTERDQIDRFLREAAADERGSRAREALCEGLAETFAEAGQLLWIDGSMIGSDRVTGTSPFQNGSDAVVGLATVVQIAHELTSGAIQLLRADSLYAAAALIRQTVEVEYLAWAFSEAQDEAASWLRASRQDRLKLWQPRHLRDRADGRFRAPDYATHCDTGGHPTPRAVHLLRGHSARQPAGVWWSDLAIHALAIWRSAVAASAQHADGETVLANVDVQRIDQLAADWNRDDQLLRLTRRPNPNSLWGQILDRVSRTD